MKGTRVLATSAMRRTPPMITTPTASASTPPKKAAPKVPESAGKPVEICR